jgi:DNA-binding NarL/FixJ family response regulator
VTVGSARPAQAAPARHRQDEVLRVVLADDAPLFRQGLVGLLGLRGISVVAEVDDARELADVVRAERPHAAVVDVRMPPTYTDEGLRAAVAVREETGCPVLVLSGHVETAHLERLLVGRPRGIGYLLKDRVGSADQLAEALRRVADGGSAVDPDVVAELFRRRQARDALAVLSPREREILAEMAQGRSNAGIAQALVLSPKTVERHIGSLFDKLGLDAAEDGHRRVLAVLRHLAAG